MSGGSWAGSDSDRPNAAQSDSVRKPDKLEKPPGYVGPWAGGLRPTVIRRSPAEREFFPTVGRELSYVHQCNALPNAWLCCFDVCDGVNSLEGVEVERNRWDRSHNPAWIPKAGSPGSHRNATSALLKVAEYLQKEWNFLEGHGVWNKGVYKNAQNARFWKFMRKACRVPLWQVKGNPAVEAYCRAHEYVARTLRVTSRMTGSRHLREKYPDGYMVGNPQVLYVVRFCSSSPLCALVDQEVVELLQKVHVFYEMLRRDVASQFPTGGCGEEPNSQLGPFPKDLRESTWEERQFGRQELKPLRWWERALGMDAEEEQALPDPVLKGEEHFVRERDEDGRVLRWAKVYEPEESVSDSEDLEESEAAGGRSPQLHSRQQGIVGRVIGPQKKPVKGPRPNGWGRR